MRERLPVVMCLLVVAVLGAVVAVRARRGGGQDDAADKVVAQALVAAAKGDVQGYLSCFAEPLRAELQKVVAEVGTESYSATLRQRGAAMTGWALATLPAVSSGDDVRLRVDAVFRDRNEVQEYVVRRVGRSWRIIGLSGASVSRMPIAYGTAVGSEPSAGSRRQDAAEGSPNREQ